MLLTVILEKLALMQVWQLKTPKDTVNGLSLWKIFFFLYGSISYIYLERVLNLYNILCP